MAQIDSRIALGFQPTAQIESPVNNLARILQVQGAQQANQMNAMKMAEAQAAGERRNKLAALLQGQYDTPEAREDALLRGGFMDEAQTLTKGRLDSRKASADAQKAEFDTARERLGLIYNAAAGAKDQASYQVALQGLQAAGIDVSGIPPQYDPAYVEAAKQQALSEAQRLEQFWKGKDFDLNVRKQGEVERNNQVQNRISQGNLAVAQGNLRVSQDRLNFDKTKPPSGSGAGAATEGERKAATLLSRMDSSLQQLQGVLEKNPEAAKPGVFAEALRATPLIGGDTPANMVTPEARQRVEAAQLDILDAALTLGTGAAYTKEQLQGYRKSYFPQIGDDAQTVKDKQDRLNNIIEAARIAAGRAAPPLQAPSGGATSAAPQGRFKIISVE